MSISSNRPRSTYIGNEQTSNDYPALYGDSSQGKGGIIGFFSNLFGKWSGNKMTSSELQAAQINSVEASKNREWQEAMYEKYNTPAAQMRMAEEAGINPTMVATGGTAVSPMSGSGDSGSAATSTGSGGGLEGILGMLLQIAPTVSELKTQAITRDKISAEIKNINAGTKKTEGETEGIGIANYVANLTKDIKVTAAWLDNDKTAAEISSILKGIELTDSQIIVNGKQVDYLQSMIDVNSSIVDKNNSEIAVNAQKILESQENIKLMQSQINLNGVNAWQIRRLTPLMEDFQRAQTALYNAETETEAAELQNYVARTAKTMCEVAVDEKLLNSDYYDNVIKQESIATDTAGYERDSAANQAAISKVEAENAWNMLFSEFFVNMTSGIGNILNPAVNRANGRDMSKAVTGRGQSETTTVTTKEHRFDKGRDTRTTTTTRRR